MTHTLSNLRVKLWLLIILITGSLILTATNFHLNQKLSALASSGDAHAGNFGLPIQSSAYTLPYAGSLLQVVALGLLTGAFFLGSSLILETLHYQASSQQTKTISPKQPDIYSPPAAEDQISAPHPVTQPPVPKIEESTETQADVSKTPIVVSKPDTLPLHMELEEVYLERPISFSPIVTTYMDLEGRWLLLPLSLCNMLGYQEGELLGSHYTEIMHPDEVETFGEQFQRLVNGEIQSFDMEKRFMHRLDHTLWMYINCSLMADSHGSPQSLMIQMRDITNWKRADQQIRRQLEYLASLNEIDAALTASTDLNQALKLLLTQIMRQLEVDAADVLLLSPAAHSFEVAARAGFHLAEAQERSLLPGNTPSWRAIEEHRTIYIPDLLYTPQGLQISPELIAEGFVTYIAAPLISQDKIRGVLEIFHRSLLEPNTTWIKFLEGMARQITTAVDNTILFNELEQVNAEMLRLYDTTIEGWARALEMRDGETEGHSQRVTEQVVKLACAMNVSEEEIATIRYGSLLHDIGKMAIPDSILLKPGPLTEEEWIVMRKHPIYSCELLSRVEFLRPALDIPCNHHEKWDGSGYPYGLKGEEIPLAARIFAVVDVWDALSSDRPYHKAWPRAKVYQYLREQAGSHFDPKVVEAFLTILHPSI